MNRTIRKLLCRFGQHRYSTKILESTFILEDYHSLVYRMENRCIYCGKEYSELVRIPFRND